MNIPNNDQDKSQQKRLRTLIILTIGIGILIRWLAAGWYVILFGILYLIIIVIHVIIQIIAIKHIPHAKPRYSNLLILSNLLFFIGFTFQLDFDDTSAYLPILLPAVFGTRIYDDELIFVLGVVDMVAFLLLFLSWILLLALRKKLTKNDELS